MIENLTCLLFFLVRCSVTLLYLAYFIFLYFCMSSKNLKHEVDSSFLCRKIYIPVLKQEQLRQREYLCSPLFLSIQCFLSPLLLSQPLFKFFFSDFSHVSNCSQLLACCKLASLLDPIPSIISNMVVQHTLYFPVELSHKYKTTHSGNPTKQQKYISI